MGDHRANGHVCEVSQYGTAMLRVDVPGKDADVATQFYGGDAIYCVTPTTEEVARATAISYQHNARPVSRFELPAHEEPKTPPAAYHPMTDGEEARR